MPRIGSKLNWRAETTALGGGLRLLIARDNTKL
jgi:hypothetical protein